MHEEHEVELRVAVAEGLLSREEVDALREEAGRAGMSPLRLLVERGRLSEESLVSLRGLVREAVPDTRPDEAPRFPVAGWERYQPVRFLGQGGMGRVFLAYDPRLRRDVALKFVRDGDPELTRRFLTEARAQARVRHARVCEVYEVGEVDGKVFIAMQYIDGQPLSVLARALTVEQKAMVLREAALGVHEAHRVGLIHRDLKPSNILVARTAEGSLEPYVMDFGLARDWNEQGTATGTVLGTPHYMAPEQARGEVTTLDRRADVYSLGATLYSVLTGQPPIPGSNGLEVLNNIANWEPRPPRALDPDLPADLEAIALKCLEKDRSARYDSARALAEDLDRFLAGEPIQARAAGLAYRLRKKLRKHRAIASVASVSLVAVVFALGWAGLQRRDAVLREHLARRFTEQVASVESAARYSDLSPLHDTRADHEALRARMTGLEEEIRQGGERAVGPGHYALGRGYLALGDEAKARELLDSAWAHGFQEPRVAYALALVMGRIYQRELDEARRIRDRDQREARLREAGRRYREPALAYLRRSEGADVPSAGYVAALIAFYEERYEDALARLDAVGDALPWFYEAPLLRGDILVARAWRRWERGERDGALDDFDAGRRAYAKAASIGESVPSIHRALANLEFFALMTELYGQGEVLPPFTRAQEALSRALTAAPDHYPSRVLQARLYRRLAEFRLHQGGDVGAPLKQAEEAARSALELAPTSPDAPLELAQIHWVWGGYLEGRSEDPREHLRQAAGLFDGIAPEARGVEFHLNRGLVFTTWADYEDQLREDSSAHREAAIQAYLAAIALDERMPAAWSNLGTAYFSRASLPRASAPEGDLEKARAALERAQALNPGFVVPYYYAGQVFELRARLLRARGADARPELALALEQYQKGLAINPRFLALLNGMGTVLLARAQEEWDHGGDPFVSLDEARASFARMLELEPKHPAALNNLGEASARRAFYQTRLGVEPGPATRLAVESFRQTLPLLPSSATPWTNLALASTNLALFELEHGRDPGANLASASEALREALARDPNDEKAWQGLGELRGLEARWRALRGRARAGDFEAAAQAYEKALTLAPDNQEARVGFAHLCREWAVWLRGAHGEPGPVLKRALGLAEELLRAGPGGPEAHVLHASVLAELAEGESVAEERRSLRARALEELTEALARNRNLEPGGSGLLSWLRRSGADSP
ncbi:protein kinase [Archangium violaceum]|uniref:serine/threonine-protein kinase n=1 Tax=Archangium violaceum TaxID=83451 RepID=UPI00193BAAB7|nr:serine/threonine-protein kinase [Archangium violaceum]QRK09581.1 protein kinase [Archangium violaceum]